MSCDCKTCSTGRVRSKKWYADHKEYWVKWRKKNPGSYKKWLAKKDEAWIAKRKEYLRTWYQNRKNGVTK
jgi:hypothetical protein